MCWWNQLDKNKGSRPRCVLLTDSPSDEARRDVANRLTGIVNIPDVTIGPHDIWMPFGLPIQGDDGIWDTSTSREAKLGNPNLVINKTEIQGALTDWWLEISYRANTPNWDIASTCTIGHIPGVLLVEAKAHIGELSNAGKTTPTTLNGWENHKKIGRVISDVAAEYQFLTKQPWSVSRDRQYQLSNRFAWSWKLASLGIPVVLMYLGFLNAEEMETEFIVSAEHWRDKVNQHTAGVIPKDVWESRICIDEVPLLPIVRVYDQPFDTNGYCAPANCG